MRRLLLTLLCGLVAAPAALAASRAAGDGVLELKAVYGNVMIGTVSQPARGALWGQLDSGTLRVTDPILGDGKIYVSGYEHKWTPADTTQNVTVYSGKDIHFRVTGGKYKLSFLNAQGLDLTAIGAGVVKLDGSDTVDDAGYYALDGGKWIPMPTLVPQFVPFGDQPAPVPTP
jgi:hypothetical protein